MRKNRIAISFGEEDLTLLCLFLGLGLLFLTVFLEEAQSGMVSCNACVMNVSTWRASKACLFQHHAKASEPIRVLDPDQLALDLFLGYVLDL